MPAISVEEFEQSNKLTFINRALLVEALTHRSYINEVGHHSTSDNERLEFLGDAVLDFIAGEMLFQQFIEAQEGRLTRLRAALVRRETLAEFGLAARIGEAVLLGRGEEDNGGRERAGTLCGAFEAVAGALYLDQGMDAVRNWVLPYMQQSLSEILRLDLEKDSKSILQEWSQRHTGTLPVYETVEESGPEHEKHFRVAVVLDGRRIAEGSGRNKQIAGQAAARAALAVLRETQQ